MIPPINFKNAINFGYGSGSRHKYNLDSKVFEADKTIRLSNEDAFLCDSRGVVSDYVSSLVENGYDYTAACDEGDRFARCLKSHENT